MLTFTRTVMCNIIIRPLTTTFCLSRATAELATTQQPDVLLVLDPNGVLCWEDILIDSFTNNTLLLWLRQQEDPLISEQPSGTREQLKVQGRNVNFVPPCTPCHLHVTGRHAALRACNIQNICY